MREGSTVLASGLSAPETPVLLPDGRVLLVESGADRGCVTVLSADGRLRTTIARTGRPNGAATDATGAIWVAESGVVPALLRVTFAGEIATVFTAHGGRAFLLPNDLCFGPDGALYMTDSGISYEVLAPGGRLSPEYADLDFRGAVYRFDVLGDGSVDIIDDQIGFANGIAFGPDNTLCVAETITGIIYRYTDLRRGRSSREIFGYVMDDSVQAPFKGPDGIAFDVSGDLFVSMYGEGQVTVLDRHGEVVERLRTRGGLPTNVAFGPQSAQTLFVTEAELGQVEVLQVGVDGARVFDGAEARQRRSTGRGVS
jgi:gluconolactonase